MNYFLYIAGAIVAILNHIKDWHAHKTFFRRWTVLILIILIGLAGVINSYYTGQKNVKQHEADQKEINRASANFDKVSQELISLRGEIKNVGLENKIKRLEANIGEYQKVLDSRKAALTFTFGGHSNSPVRMISLPVKDNKIHVDFSISNETDIAAANAEIQFTICDRCKFVSLSKEFTKVDYLPDTARVIRFNDIYAHSTTPLYGADIEVPADVHAVMVGIIYRCSNCPTAKENRDRENLGTIKLERF